MMGMACSEALGICTPPMPADAGAADTTSGICSVTANTTVTGTAGSCQLLSRDTSACAASRTAAGLSGFWLKLSCRVALSVVTIDGKQYVRAASDSVPDHKTMYWPSTNACYTSEPGTSANPNKIATKAIVMNIPKTAMVGSGTAREIGGPVGLVLNGVVIFPNYAAPGDDIFLESEHFDGCQGHPEKTGTYHHHSEPWSVTHDDASFVGVLLDGYPLYGRKDADGTYPKDLDANGGHIKATGDSATPAYHYHVNKQSKSYPDGTTRSEWFLTTGTYHGVAGSCASGC
jgi:hypothetical protein